MTNGPDPHGENASARPAPRLLTTTQAARRINLVIALMFAFAIPMVIISQAVIMWVAVLAVWMVLWAGFWLRWGRYWHPVRQFRYEWGGYRQGSFKRSSDSEADYRRAWQESDGAPPAVPPPPGDTPT